MRIPRRWALWCAVLLAPPALLEQTCHLRAEEKIGDTEHVFALAPENRAVRGLAMDDQAAGLPRLYTLDLTGKIFAYELVGADADGQQTSGAGELKLLEVFDLPPGGDRAVPASPRGLAFAREEGHEVFYFLSWDKARGGPVSQLWRSDRTTGVSQYADLSLAPLRIGDRETLDVAVDNGQLIVCFDAAGYVDHDWRVQRGVVRLKWNSDSEQRIEFVRHMPDAGTQSSRGVACMELDGTGYVWATVGDEHVYCAEARTGRGLFHFERPRSGGRARSCWGLCFGDGSLWVPEDVPGPDVVRRVNVVRNLDACRTGPRMLRHLVMTIESAPEANVENPGAVYHFYSRPYDNQQMPNQGIWAETEQVVDVSDVASAATSSFHDDPAGDKQVRQYMNVVEYSNAAPRIYSSSYEIDLWMRSYRKYVYPHRANRDCAALQGTDYLADDPELYNLSDRETYQDFFERVREHIQRKYGVAADLDNPYWAARNTLEYIQDHYYYPIPPKRKPAAVDYTRKHYDANPGNLKIALSGRSYDKSQIIACSGTSVVLVGAMRYLGIPARWLGTGTQEDGGAWDTNGNGLLDEDETAGCSNGHRYTQVWLGSHYGWICFDATPTRPDFNDFDPTPPLQSQWRFMNRSAAGHLKEKRIVFNVGSGFYRPLYRDFEYDADLAIDNNCGGDQRYNLQGRFEKPEFWQLARHRIAVKNLCFIDGLVVDRSGKTSSLTWSLKGAWDRDPRATVSVSLQQLDPKTNRTSEVATLARMIPADSQRLAVDLSQWKGRQFRIILRKDGDPETGGHSQPFDLD